jgi:hypothetical protein
LLRGTEENKETNAVRIAGVLSDSLVVLRLEERKEEREKDKNWKK